MDSNALVVDPEQRRRRRLEHSPVRGDQKRLVEAALAREPAAQHVRPVGERLDPVEHPRRGVLDDSEPDALRSRGQRLGQEQPPAATREHHPQQAVELGAPALGE